MSSEELKCNEEEETLGTYGYGKTLPGTPPTCEDTQRTPVERVTSSSCRKFWSSKVLADVPPPNARVSVSVSEERNQQRQNHYHQSTSTGAVQFSVVFSGTGDSEEA